MVSGVEALARMCFLQPISCSGRAALGPTTPAPVRPMLQDTAMYHAMKTYLHRCGSCLL